MVGLNADRLAQAEAFIFDIEGTICSISFVKDSLYPYFIEALPQYARDNWSDPDFKTLKKLFPREARQTPEALIQHCQDLVANDVKDMALKQLQGRIWAHGYHTGAYTAPLYADALRLLHTFHSLQLPLAVYSSGSVEAQQLLCSHVHDPNTNSTIDINHLFIDPATGNEELFDTVNAGSKTVKESYGKVAKELSKEVGKCVYFTDNPLEAIAADVIGMYVVMVARPGNAPLGEAEHGSFAVVEDFGEIEKIVEDAKKS